MSSTLYKIFILLVLFSHIIKGLDVCEDKSNDCQPCNLQYPIHLPTRENCMETCQVCTNKNVALRQTTRQSSLAYSGESKRAVDGDTNGVYFSGSSCTHTADNTNTHWWCVDLKKIYNIKNITMYNRVDSKSERLQGFELKTSSSGQCNWAGFITSSPCYKNDPPTNQTVYTIDRCNQDSNKSIVAGTLFVSVTGVPLIICEFQVFTGTCSPGYFTTSSSTCEPCDDGCSDNKCNPDTGDCIGDCKSGFYGTKCQQKCSEGCENKECTKLDGSCSCINGWFGPRCQLQCNTGCKDNICDRNNGRCSQSCIPGRFGDHCEDTCSQGCSTPDCERDGTCSCKDGYKGSYCQTPCDVNCRRCDVVSCTVCKPGWYGDNCESRCPTGCKETCNKTSGTCDECKEGAVGLYCDIKCGEECRTMTEEEKRWSICKEANCKRDCRDKYYGESSEVIISRCNYLCIGGRKSETCLRVEEISVQEKNTEDSINPVTSSSIGVIVGLIVGGGVIGLICWLCCIRRRQPGDQQDTRTDQRRHNNSISTNQPSTIIQNEAFLSDQETNIYDTLDHTAAQNDTYTNANSSLTNK